MNEQEREVRELIIRRRRECGIGLFGRYEAIAQWLFREHNTIVSTSWVADVIRGEAS